MLGMSELYLARPDPNIYNFVNTQLLSNVYNNVDDSWLFGMWWGGPVRPSSSLSPFPPRLPPPSLSSLSFLDSRLSPRSYSYSSNSSRYLLGRVC